MIDIIQKNLFIYLLIISSIIFLIWLGWRLRKWWKNFIFFLSRIRAKKGERNSIKLLKANGYKILDEQIKLNGYFFIDNKLNKFDLRPDLLVEKNGIKYIAEIKTGEVANPNNRYTRRQMHEYSFYSNQDDVLLVDPTNKSIKKLTFKKN